MENINAEQVKKALSDCLIGDCEPCAYRKIFDCRDSMCFDALALINSQEQRIKELEQCWEHEHDSAMEIIGQWSAKCEQLSVDLDAMRGAANSYKMHSKTLEGENEKLKALVDDGFDTENALNEKVKKLSEENEGLTSSIKILVNNNADLEFELAQTYDLLEESKADTVRKMQERSHEQFHDRVAYTRSYVHDTIDQIAKEMLEDHNNET